MSDALTEADAIDWLSGNAFSLGKVGVVGAELEWIVVNPRQPGRRPAIAEVLAALRLDGEALPARGSISFEPGGQLELSTVPAASLSDCLEAVATDLSVIRSRLAQAGIELVGCGMDRRSPERLVESPRYRSIEHHHDQFGPMGRLWMCNTASVQITLDAGDESDGWSGWRRRWHLANKLGPIFLAMFANSHSMQWQSARQMVRFHTDPTRSDPMILSGDPRAVWANYVLDAYVTGISSDGPMWAVPPRWMTMRRWLQSGIPRPAGLDDLRAHVMTVAPPVRPRGYLELRMIDAQAGDYWVVPLTVVAALIDDPSTSEIAVEIADKLKPPEHRDDWLLAARLGLQDAALASVAQACMEAVLEALPRLSIPDWAAATVATFSRIHLERHIERGTFT